MILKSHCTLYLVFLLAIFLVCTSAAYAKTCPVDGEEFPDEFAFCPKHGKKLVDSGGGETATETDPVTGMSFVWVEGGCFEMGSARGEDDEKPVHKVCVDGFWMGTFEVTQGEWEKVMGNNPSKFKGSDRPVETVSWNDAQEYIARLNQQTEKRYGLPTEAQWEYAARGGVKSRGFEYAGSNVVNEVAWYNENSGGTTIPVGRKLPNELGLYDMSGNVWEWCLDWYDQGYYRWGPSDNPAGPDGGSLRVFRGGGWDSSPGSVRAANRGWDEPGGRFVDLGFRLVRTE